MPRFFRKEIHAAAFLLGAILVHNLIYPLSRGDGAEPFLFYVFFSSIFVVGVWELTNRSASRWVATISGLTVFGTGLANSYAPSPLTALTLYVSVIAYHLVIIVELARYIFEAEEVRTEVLLSATSLYLIIGSMFTAFYGLVEWIQPDSFASSSGGAVEWQEFLYFSYVTLTSLGYGDITPTGFYAQALASFEAVVGVLYTVILLSRLVSMHQKKRSRSEGG